MKHQKITKDDILHGRYSHYYVKKVPFQDQSIGTKHKLTLMERFFPAVAFTLILFLSCSFFLPITVKSSFIFALLCVLVSCIFSLHFLYLVGALDVSLSIDALIQIIIQIIVSII